MRQVKNKWPVNCSRSCARKAQHLRNHGWKRKEKECEICSTPFVTTNWDKEKKYCSSKCVATARFGEKDTLKTRQRLDQILGDPPYYTYIKSVAGKIGHKFKKGEEFKEEVIQEYFLKLWEGQNTTIENVAKSMLRKEIKKGITGKWESDFSFIPQDALAFMKTKRRELNSIEFKEYLIDIFNILNEREREFFVLYLKGFKDREVIKEIRKKFPTGNQRFYDDKKQVFKKITLATEGVRR